MCTNISKLFLQINLNGCHRITETGLYSLVSSCKKLKTVSIVGTDVSILPQAVRTMDISLTGYPAVSPNTQILKDKGLAIMSGK